jgi:hypothetical protein
VGQSNVAHLYDLGRTPLTARRKHRALAAFQRAAQQGNVVAELKIGDYYFYGFGTAVNFRSAVAHYRAASEARNAQAMFGLGYMHEHGIGIARDLHLAKRFYDMAAETAEDAVWPVMLARAKLWVVMTLQERLAALDAFSHRVRPPPPHDASPPSPAGGRRLPSEASPVRDCAEAVTDAAFLSIIVSYPLSLLFRYRFLSVIG